MDWNKVQYNYSQNTKFKKAIDTIIELWEDNLFEPLQDNRELWKCPDFCDVFNLSEKELSNSNRFWNDFKSLYEDCQKELIESKSNDEKVANGIRYDSLYKNLCINADNETPCGRLFWQQLEKVQNYNCDKNPMIDALVDFDWSKIKNPTNVIAESISYYDMIKNNFVSGQADIYERTFGEVQYEIFNNKELIEGEGFITVLIFYDGEETTINVMLSLIRGEHNTYC